MILELLLIFPALLIGVLAHEATHYLAAMPFSEDVRFTRPTPTSLGVEYDYYDHDWRHRAGDVANLMPAIIGVIGIPAIYLSVGFPALVVTNLWLFAGAAAFVVGGRADFVRTFV
jgi:hypothetical protein